MKIKARKKSLDEGSNSLNSREGSLDSSSKPTTKGRNHKLPIINVSQDNQTGSTVGKPSSFKPPKGGPGGSLSKSKSVQALNKSQASLPPLETDALSSSNKMDNRSRQGNLVAGIRQKNTQNSVAFDESVNRDVSFKISANHS